MSLSVSHPVFPGVDTSPLARPSPRVSNIQLLNPLTRKSI